MPERANSNPVEDVFSPATSTVVAGVPAAVHDAARGGLTARSRRPLVAALLAMLAVTILAITAWPVRAAVVLDFFEVIASPDEVLLEWSTLAEFNIEGFNIYCKEAAEPPAAYHIIGTEVAQGSTDVGYFYSFAVTQLEPGVAYCFRIEEVTTDGTAPEQFDRCGFGLNITPTPTPVILPGAGVVDNSPLQTPPVESLNQTGSVPSLDATATPPTFDTQPAQPTATPIAGSPLGNAAPPVPPDANAAANNAVANNAVANNPVANNAAQSPLGAASGTTMISPDGSGAQSQNATPPGADTALAQVPPTPLYIVLTATPTSPVAAAEAVAPTLTPLPTATPGSATLLAALRDVNAENILLATLCLVFVGGSGLGILGITSLGLYLRARSDKPRASAPPSSRRYRA